MRWLEGKIATAAQATALAGLVLASAAVARRRPTLGGSDTL